MKYNINIIYTIIIINAVLTASFRDTLRGVHALGIEAEMIFA